tara:strand:+ start:42 stop:275 length:234 start_codon:yes stop_codon:yes gene_type:complete
MNRDLIVCRGKDVISQIKAIVKKGNANRIIVRTSQGRVLLNLPINMIAIGAFLSPMIAGLSVTLALIKKCELEVTSH